MTLTMADAIDVNQLPSGYDAYAGYVNGNWPDYNAIVARFPNAHHLSISVFLADAADCLDIEQGDATPAQAPTFVDERIAAGIWRPCLYASISTMNQVVGALGNRPRSSYRLWSAHYGQGSHICGPATCNYGGNAPQCDGTQWNSLTTPNIDESILASDFFQGATMALQPLDPSELPVVDPHENWVTDPASGKPSFQVTFTGKTSGKRYHRWWDGAWHQEELTGYLA